MHAQLSRSITPHLCCLILLGGFMATAIAAGGPTNAPAKTGEIEVAKSTFLMPRNKTEGRDPFYPSSSYPYELGASKGGSNQPPSVSVDLKLTAIGGTPDKRLCTINGRTLAKGEDGEMTVSGSKVQVHIVEILDESVVLTVNGEERELRFRRFFQ